MWFNLRNDPKCPKEFKSMGPCKAGNNCFWVHGPTLTVDYASQRRVPRGPDGKVSCVLKYDKDKGDKSGTDAAPGKETKDKPPPKEKKEKKEKKGADAASVESKGSKGSDKQEKKDKKKGEKKSKKSKKNRDDSPAAPGVVVRCPIYEDGYECDGTSEECPGVQYHYRGAEDDQEEQ
jgi:hypothetical protein